MKKRRTRSVGSPHPGGEARGHTMAIEDLGKKASDFAKENSAKINDALQSEQAEGISDKLLGGAADLANKITGGKHAEKIEDVRANLDDKIGNE